MTTTENKDQQHPQEDRDRQLVDRLLQENSPSNFHLAELARLRIRYRGFPGARDVQQSLDTVLQRWNLTEEILFEQTRQLHANAQGYKPRNGSSQGQDDWS
ncbi:MAG: DUF3288 family protein [Kastovskya adunca ATA6-11-RM4]|jgi:hypothetical protein|nr:DUF3288 family protein [Kastovskya adunca ATA6-11-RM4]